jgi:hypothetical protein
MVGSDWGCLENDFVCSAGNGSFGGQTRISPCSRTLAWSRESFGKSNCHREVDVGRGTVFIQVY